MAKPIKETPFLRGKDAKKFVEDNKSIQKVSKEELKEINDNYEALKSLADF